jgi:predicted phosphoadenosine phosphosulfate sulfurtransferase
MAGRTGLGMNVFDAAVMRLTEQYEQGHRIVVSISGGKDSTCCVELAAIAAARAGRLPVEAVTRDEEINAPGTYEYLERLHERDDIDLTWLVAHQPIVNAFDREAPFWWTFDQRLDPDEWVRKYPPYAIEIPEINIEAMTTYGRFPPEPGKELRAVVGLRASESRWRTMGVHSSGGYLTGPIKLTGVRNIRPIYDWQDGDVWKAIKTKGWDYNRAYDVMLRLGIPAKGLRISPPTLNPGGGTLLQKVHSTAWPGWWDRVCRRLPSVRTFAKYGMVLVTPQRRLGETWEGCFQRTCVDGAPEWIRQRAVKAREQVVSRHPRHSTAPFPEAETCYSCYGNLGSWKALAYACYLGDPFSLRLNLPYVDPQFFRPELAGTAAGKWDGHPG